MAGFIRRFGYFPPVELITQIEGVVIVDQPPPPSIQGVGTGVVALVGEFADCSYGVSVASDGTVTTSPQPVEVFSAQDMLDKVGGFDETLGEFGGDCGNGFVELRSKKFNRLVLVPVNMASSKGVRVWRSLPTNKGASDANPVVPVQSAVVAAGREFKVSAQRMRLRKRVVFTSSTPKVQVTDATTSTQTAVTHTITSATGLFQTNGVKEGDIVVLGVIGGAGFLGGNALTLRVVAVGAENSMTVQAMDGSSITITTNNAAAQPMRIHPASDADTGGEHQFSEEQGYLIPAQPLDSTIAQSALATPTVVPTALTATSADPLSGLKAAITSNASGLVYTAAIQAPNAANSSDLAALYSSALDSLIADDAPASEVNLVWSARKYSTIRALLKTHELNANQRALSRIALVSPSLDGVVTTSAAIASADPGVGATRDESVLYQWPGVQVFIPEAVGFSIKGADGSTITNGQLDVTSDGFMAAILSNLAPERNPGQAGPPVPQVMSPVLALQRGLTTKLDRNDYIALRANGVCAPRMDRTVGPIFQSGVTSSLTAGQKNINRRRMANFIQDSIATSLLPFSKSPLTNALKDSSVGEVVAFLEGLKSPNNPAAQRIVDYEVDDKSGNTPELEAAGIFVIIARVRTLATADFIVIQSEVGEGVLNVTQRAA